MRKGNEVLTRKQVEKDEGIKQMLEKHVEWLNGWNKAAAERGDGDPGKVALQDYWSVEGDEPRVWLDQREGELGGWPGDRRLVVLLCSPFHDEGGPAILTGHMEWDDGMRWDDGEIFEDERGKEVRRGGGFKQTEEPRWSLRGMTQEFDTYLNVVVSSGALVEDWVKG